MGLRRERAYVWRDNQKQTGDSNERLMDHVGIRIRSTMNPAKLLAQLCAGVTPWASVLSAEQLVGLIIANDLFMLAIPLDATSQL